MISETIANTNNSNSIRKIQYTANNIAKIEEIIVGWSSLFSDINWVTSIQDKLIKVSKLFEINRGERRGWDEMFFPKEYSKIESEFIKPVLKSSKNVTGYIAEPEGKAFCCSVSIEELKLSSKDGALEWISRFKNGFNTDGKPLIESLKRSNHFWYEMKPETLADFVITMNPDKKLFIARMSERSFVNQRLIRFTSKESVDLDICHALLNSTLGMFFIETSGFGRGLGALDLNSTKLKKGLSMLNPELLDEESKENIVQKFRVVMLRGLKAVPDELSSSDRQALDKAILTAYGLEGLKEKIYKSLLEIYSIRQAVKL